MTGHGTIVLAVYRPNPVLLKRQLHSIMNQSLTNWHCIIGLDGPDQQTRSDIEEITRSDPRFEIIPFPENVGVYRHFERLLGGVDDSSQWIALADQDDYWHPRKLERLVSRLTAEDVSGVSCQARLTTESGAQIGLTSRRAKPVAALLIINEVTGCLSIFRRELLALALPFPPPSRLAIHDHWLGVCAMASRGFIFTDDVLQDYVQHDGNVIGERSIRSIPAALLDLVRGNIRWAEITREPWRWRVDMANTLLGRTPLSESAQFEAVARGTLSWSLVRLLWRQAWSGQIPRRVAVSLTAAATAAIAKDRNYLQEAAGQR